MKPKVMEGNVNECGKVQGSDSDEENEIGTMKLMIDFVG